jgi:hypothetical protein
MREMTEKQREIYLQRLISYYESLEMRLNSGENRVKKDENSPKKGKID